MIIRVKVKSYLKLPNKFVFGTFTLYCLKELGDQDIVSFIIMILRCLKLIRNGIRIYFGLNV